MPFNTCSEMGQFNKTFVVTIHSYLKTKCLQGQKQPPVGLKCECSNGVVQGCLESYDWILGIKKRQEKDTKSGEIMPL